MNNDLVIHVDLAEPELLQRAFGNTRNYVAALQAKRCRVAIVVNGPAVSFFRRDHDRFSAEIAEVLRLPGISVVLCANALQKMGIDSGDLVAGCRVVPAGVVELVRLHEAGYAYVKP